MNDAVKRLNNGELRNESHDDTNDDDVDDVSTLLTTNTAPLRILIIGDSLAAGVGTSRSSTPILPETIAQALSKALGGRAVLWTCFGVPGQTSSEIVHSIQHLEDIFTSTTKNHTTLLQRFNEWQGQQRQNAQHRIEAAKRKTKEWIEQRKNNNEDEQPSSTVRTNRFVRWWKRTRILIRNDIQSIRNILNRDDNACDDELVIRNDDMCVQSSLLEQATIGKYDIAIVLTGLNDLKESLLPFMRSSERTKVLKQYKLEQRQHCTHTGQSDSDIDNDTVYKEQGMKGELILILNALLESQMQNRRENETTINSINENDQNVDKHIQSSSKEKSVEHKGPLIVFPALPYQPTVLSQHVPLSWFMIPLLNMVDQNKKLLSELYPGLVLYVESPDIKDWSDATLAQHGTIWEDFRVLFKLNDIAQDAKERIEQLMKRHYERWVSDAGTYDIDIDSNIDNSILRTNVYDENDSLYEFDAMGNVTIVHHHSILKKRGTIAQPGSIMVAADGIHPSDIGYDMWGRHIADAIIKEWQKVG
jgi:lysophospholipase L1-like esterase